METAKQAVGHLRSAVDELVTALNDKLETDVLDRPNVGSNAARFLEELGVRVVDPQPRAGEEVPPAVLDRPVDDPPEVGLRLLLARFGVYHVQVADDAGVRLARPGKETLVIFLNQPDHPIGRIDLVCT